VRWDAWLRAVVTLRGCGALSPGAVADRTEATAIVNMPRTVLHPAAESSESARIGRPLRIGIDMRPMRMPGIGRYVTELVTHLAAIDGHDQFLLYFDSGHAADPFRNRWANFATLVVPSPVYSVGEQIRLPLRILRDRLDLFHAPTSLVVPLLCPCPLVVTVHDLLLKLHPEHLPSRLAGAYFAVMNSAALGLARQLLVVSEFTREQVAGAYPRHAGKTHVTHNAAGERFRPQDTGRIKALRQRLGLGPRYILYVGTYKKHKNLLLLVRGYGGLPPEMRSQWQLVLLGKRDPRFPESDEWIARLGLEAQVMRVDRVEEDDLAGLYSGAQIVAAPSRYEGFGFPVLEAMACGTPVVATRIAPFIEVAGDAALFVDPDDFRGMTQALGRLIESPELRREMSAAGLARSAKFSWHETAVATLAVYRSATHRAR
jgi:glycosyltransferase involved in cell wall biosynthesis